MYRKKSITDLNRTEWLKLRKMGIGGSDSGAICGVNPYTSPMKIYLDKTSDTISIEDNEAMRQGRDLEDYVARRFMESTGLRVHKSNVMYQSVEHPFMLANVDRIVVGEDAGLECKTASAYNADKWKDGAIPAHYVIQCYHYMAVTGKRNWYIAVLILGIGFQYAKITWDDVIIRNLVQQEKDFWENHVVPRIMPDPDGSKVCDEILEQYFHVSKRNSQIPLIGFDDKLDRRNELTAQIKRMETEQRMIDQQIKLYMGTHEQAESEHYRVNWCNVESTKLDAKRIKAERPDIYEEFCISNSSRRFSVKTA